MENNTIVGQMLSFFGITGRGVSSVGLAAPSKNASSTDVLREGVSNSSEIWSTYANMMKKPSTFEEAIKLWEDMGSWDLMSAALSTIVDETLQHDGLHDDTLWYECSDANVEKELNQMLVNIKVEEILPSQVYYIAGLGNHFEKLDYITGEGIVGSSMVHPLYMKRYWLKRNKALIGFSCSDPQIPAPVRDSNNNQGGTLKINTSDSKETQNLWYPWDFLHFRRIYRSRFAEVGEPLFSDAEGIYKKLKMAIDQMTVLRAQIQPDRYKFVIDTKDQPLHEQYATLNRFKQNMRSKVSFGLGGEAGTPNDFKSYYSPWALDTVLYLAKPSGFEHSIDKIAGTATIPDIYDIELLENMFFSIIGMPRSWVTGNLDGSGNNPASGKALLAQDIRFLRKVKALRKSLTTAYTQLGYTHLIIKNKYEKNVMDKVKIVTKMPPVGSLEDQMTLDLVKVQADILKDMAEIMELYNLPKDAWVNTVFKKFLKLPDELISVFLTALPNQVELQDSKYDSEKTVLKAIQERFGPEERDMMVKKFVEVSQKPRSRLSESYQVSYTNLCTMPSVRANDLIVSSFGSEFLTNPTAKTPEKIQETRKVVSTHVNRKSIKG